MHDTRALEAQLRRWLLLAILSGLLAILCGVMQATDSWRSSSRRAAESTFFANVSIAGRDSSGSMLVDTFTACHNITDCAEKLCLVYQHQAVSNVVLFPQRGKCATCSFPVIRSADRTMLAFGLGFGLIGVLSMYFIAAAVKKYVAVMNEVLLALQPPPSHATQRI